MEVVKRWQTPYTDRKMMGHGKKLANKKKIYLHKG